MFAPAVFVCEKAPKWESELKRRLTGPELLVRPCRSTTDCLELCRQAPGSVVVLDLALGAADGLRLLESLAGQKLDAAVVVVAPRELMELEWPARELGAVEFVTDVMNGDALAVICRRILTRPAKSSSTATAPAARGPG